MQEGKYNVKAVSHMLGIQPGTLRAWERRYHFIAPVRNEAGHRLYSDRNVEVLRWLVEKTKRGFTISQAVSLLEQDSMAPGKDAEAEPSGDRTAYMSERLLQALLSFDEDKAHQIMDEAFSVFTLEKVIISIIGTVLVQIGDKWEKGEITSAHEHFSSAILRSRLSYILHTLPVNPMMPKAVMICGPGERHEFGLLVFSFFLRRKGFRTIYIGPSAADGDLETVLDIVRPEYLFVSCTVREHASSALEWISRLAKERPELHIGAGGTAFSELAADSLDIFLGDTQTEWEDWLGRRKRAGF